MKKIAKDCLVIFVLAFLLFTISCSDDGVYSCDPELNDWIKSNKSELANAELGELTSNYAFAVQSSIFGSLSPVKKQNLWLEKYDLILKQAGFTIEEKAHISTLRNYVKSNLKIFEETGLGDTQLVFLEIWKAEGLSKFNWNDWDIIYLGTTLYAKQEERTNLRAIFENDLKNENGVSKAGRTQASECACNQQMSGCNIMHSCAPSRSCSPTNSGCGWFWSQSCNGECFV